MDHIEGDVAGDRRCGLHRTDLLAYGAFLVGALYVMAHLWFDVRHRSLAINPTDQAFAEWIYADQSNAITQLRNPFFSHGQNVPLGINLMGNVATPLASWILAPITLLLGPPVTFAVATTVNLAATASAWYHVLSRHLVRHRAAAFTGAAFCGFSPGMISQSNAHVHIPAQYLVPFIVLAVIRLRLPGRTVRNGVVLGLLVSAQLLLGEEILFLTACGCAVMVACYAASRWQRARGELAPFAGGLGVALAVVLGICAYPLWMQFFGPRHYSGIIAVYNANLSNFVAYPAQSLGGLTAGVSHTPNLAEQSSFFGWPLAIGATGLGLLLWRSLPARLAAVTGAVTAVLSLGPTITWKGWRTQLDGIPGPYRLLSDLPIFDSLITLRLSLVTSVTVGLLLAFGTVWVIERAPAARAAGVPLRLIAAGVAAIMLVPLIPRPLPAMGKQHVPHFITSDAWRPYVGEARTLVPVDRRPFTALRWAAAGRARFAVPGGFTLVPADPPRDMTGVFNVRQRPTEEQLTRIVWGTHPAIGDGDRRQAAEDMRWLRADIVVLDRTVPDSARLAEEISSLLDRPTQQVDDVYLWQVDDI